MEGEEMDTLLSKSEIPIVDISHVAMTGSNGACNGPCMNRIATQLRKALSQKGLAFLVNHGIRMEKVNAAHQALEQFCRLPEKARETYKRENSSKHGYVPPGKSETYSNANVKEIRHSFNVTSLARKLPEAEVAGFQAVVTSLAHDFRKLTCLLLRALATSLELPADYFLKTHSHIFEEDNETCMRLMYYPPFGAPPAPGTTRCGEHADYGTFTLLTQDCEGGLEILTKGDRWRRVGHLPGAILINTGALLSSWTSNKLPALFHRVVVPEQSVLRCRGRHSIAFFVHPDNNAEMKPIPLPDSLVNEPVTPETTSPPEKPHGRKFHRHNSIYTAYQHLQMRFRETYAS